MQSNWGPRIFWLVVFILAGAGIYVYFSEPEDDLSKMRFAAPLASMVNISSQVGAVEIQFGPTTGEDNQWRGEVKLAKGKVLQLYGQQADGSSLFSASRFECSPLKKEGKLQPILLHLVYQADADDTLTLTLNKKTQKIVLSTLPADGQKLEALENTVTLKRVVPVQFYENDSQADDHHPYFTTSPQGRDFLLYMNSERSKGIDLKSILSGSFESLETPIVGTTLRLSQYRDGAWQYSEAVSNNKLETCLDPVAAMDNTGRMFVAWVQKSGTEGWDIYTQFKDFGADGDSSLSWNKPLKLTGKPGYYHQLAAATDSKGRVWLTWQAWRADRCQIEAAVLNDDKHFMKNPGPVAAQSLETDGRWFPTIACDKLGNTYIAWSVLRKGRYEIEVMKLYDNMLAGKPLTIISSLGDAQRPSLACDAENRVWLAYEESTPPVNFGDLNISQSQVRVNTLRPDGSIDVWPALSLPATIGQGANERCVQPRMIITKKGLPLVVWQAGQQVYVSQWKSSAWTPPQSLSQTPTELAVHHTAVHQAGHLVDCLEAMDNKGRIRMRFAAQRADDDGPTLPQKAAAATAPPPPPTSWRSFVELARQFRKRSEDLILSKRYLLRGLVLLPNALDAFAHDPWSAASTALEQGMYDGVVVPQPLQSPSVTHWQTTQRADVMTQQSDKNVLVGYYRPFVGQKEPMLIIDSKKDEIPLQPLSVLDADRRATESGTRVSVTTATDRSMLTTFLNQRQRLGFSLTTDWRMLPILTQPGKNDAYNESLERILLPYWHPETTPARPAHTALRMVAYAYGKSYDHLLDALKARHFYVATDDIYVTVRCDRHLPGDVFQTSFRPAITITAQGTTKLKAVEVWLDNTLVKAEEPPGAVALMEYIFDKPDRQWHSYTVRVIQENGAEAVVQPFWIRYLP